MKKIILLVTLAISALTASAQNWTSFNSFGFQRKINGTDTTYRVLGAGVNTPYLYLKSDWSMKQLLDGKANLVGGNTFTGNQIIQDQQPNLEIKSTLLNQSFKLGYAGDLSSAFSINNHQGKRMISLSNPVGSNFQPQMTLGNYTAATPSESQLFIYGGLNGANIDARGRAEKDEANIDLEGSDWTTSPSSLGFSYYGINNTTTIPNTLGYTAKKLAQIRFNQANHALITSFKTDSIVPIRFGINNIEIANISDKGWSYQSNFASVNSDNPRWLVDKGYADGLVSNKANTDASNINVVNYKTALGIPSTGGYDLQSVLTRGNSWISSDAYANVELKGAEEQGGNGVKFFGANKPYAEIYGEYEAQNIGKMFLRTFSNGVSTNAITILGSNSNVGIGTTSPSAKLDVSGSIRASGNATLSGQTLLGNATALTTPPRLDVTNGAMTIRSTNNDAGIMIDPKIGYVSFETMNGTGLAVKNMSFATQSGSNVGFGNSSPSAKVDVTGSIRASANDGNTNTVVRNGDLGNYVTTNTVQSISGNKSFNGTVSVTTAPTSNTDVIRVQDFATQGKEGVSNVTSSANTTFPITDNAFGYSTNIAVYVDASTAPVNIILPAVANTTGKKILIFKTDSSANAVTINGPGALIYINGSATYTLTSQYASVEIHANSTQYYAK